MTFTWSIDFLGLTWMYPVLWEIVIRSSESPVSESPSCFDLAAFEFEFETWDCGESGFEPIFFLASSNKRSCSSLSVCLPPFFFSPSLSFFALFFFRLFSESTSDFVSSVSPCVVFESSFDFFRIVGVLMELFPEADDSDFLSWKKFRNYFFEFLV